MSQLRRSRAPAVSLEMVCTTMYSDVEALMWTRHKIQYCGILSHTMFASNLQTFKYHNLPHIINYYQQVTISKSSGRLPA